MLAAAAVAAALAASGPRVGMEPGALVGSAPRWVQGERCSAGEPVAATFMMRLTAPQAAELEEIFWAVSTPGAERYGQHLSRAELRRVVAASDEALVAVHDWLKEAGVTGARTADTGDSVRATIPCETAERLFATEFRAFRHSKHTAVRLLRAAAPYSLPREIAEVVSVVADLIALPRLDGATIVAEEPAAKAFPAGADCGGKCGASFTTPGVLTKAYSLGAAPTGPQKGSMAVAEFQGVMWDSSDLDKWGTACAVNATVNHQIGKNSPFKCQIPGVGTELCAEALLDIEYIKGVGGSIPLSDVFDSTYSLLNWMTQVLDMPDATLPLVHSVSYGNDEVQQTSAAYMQSCNQQFMKAGARGVSVLFASGDQGVLGRSGKGARYHPDFPAGSPYITAVGGTDFAEKSVIGAEKAWTQGGGGFSDNFATPSYQAAAVKQYFGAAGAALPAAAKWNNTGRGYPDVSALGGQQNPYCIHAGGLFAGVAGTSASCPVVAAVFARLNEVRLARGDKPLGFLNPLIYQLGGKGFNDVTQGRNCGSATCSATDGFPAVAGWDAATGWGTPNFEQLKTLV
eukprot:TRINITY_DN1459_c0_g1_i2.p1 TRINITY_DN1459_c0_g1~~TRINITY_DN1459_c0_g1_i2.p1  ORF type:complete len:600 (+),score=225.37 TRINITY_DN1459_c0_g1_i2:88-1800(+)